MKIKVFQWVTEILVDWISKLVFRTVNKALSFWHSYNFYLSVTWQQSDCCRNVNIITVCYVNNRDCCDGWESSVEIEDCGCMCLVWVKSTTGWPPGCCAALARTGPGHLYPVTALLLLTPPVQVVDKYITGISLRNFTPLHLQQYNSCAAIAIVSFGLVTCDSILYFIIFTDMNKTLFKYKVY